MTNHIEQMMKAAGIEPYTNNCWDSELPDEIPCKDRTDCKIKQIVELCKSAVDICNCKDADKDIDCHWCKEGGRADIGRKILQILKTQEAK